MLGKVLGKLLRGTGKVLKGAANITLKGFGGAGMSAKGTSQWEIADLRQRNLSALQRMAAGIVDNMDTFVHSIAVRVRGGPAADLRAVYFLACAAAFGRYSRGVTRVRGGYFQMDAHIDVTNKEVTVTVGYRTGGIGTLLRPSSGKFGVDRARTPHDVMFEGPDQVTIGASWMMPFTVGTTQAGSLAVVSGGILLNRPATDTARFNSNVITSASARGAFSQDVPWVITYPAYYAPDPLPTRPMGPVTDRVAFNPFRELPYENPSVQQLYLRRHAPVGILGGGYVIVQRIDSARVPILPDDGRLITTGETNFPAVQPPRPPVDALARGGLVALVAQALTNPGYLPTTPRRYDGNVAASSGLYTRPPGTVAPGVQATEWVDLNVNRNPTQATPPNPIGIGAAAGGFGLIPTAAPSAPNVTE